MRRLRTMDSAIDAGIEASNADDFTAFVVANAGVSRSLDGAGAEPHWCVAALARYIDHVQDHPPGDADAAAGAGGRAGAVARNP